MAWFTASVFLPEPFQNFPSETSPEVFLRHVNGISLGLIVLLHIFPLPTAIRHPQVPSSSYNWEFGHFILGLCRGRINPLVTHTSHAFVQKAGGVRVFFPKKKKVFLGSLRSLIPEWFYSKSLPCSSSYPASWFNRFLASLQILFFLYNGDDEHNHLLASSWRTLTISTHHKFFFQSPHGVFPSLCHLHSTAFHFSFHPSGFWSPSQHEGGAHLCGDSDDT